MRTAVIVALVFAVGLAFATFVVLRRPAPASPAPVAWLAALSESSTDAIRFSWGEQTDDLRIVADPAAGWKLERSAPAGGLARWPVQAAQVRGGLRLLADLAKLHHSDQAVMRNAQTTLIAFSKGTSDVGSIRIATKGLGGQAPAIIGDTPSRFVFVEEALSRAFLREGVLQWRTPLAFPGMATTAQRIVIENSTAKVELVRSRGAWIVGEPLRTPASEAAMKQLLATLASIPISKFADDADPNDAKIGLASPIASIRVETPLPGAEGASHRRMLVERIDVGGPADVARTAMFVRAGATIEGANGESSPAWGPVVAVVDRSRLDPIAGEPGAYASKAVLRESPADIVRLRVVDPTGERAGYTRTIDGWFGMDNDGKLGAKVEGERSKALLGLIELLCAERASEVRRDQVDAMEVVVTIEPGVTDGPLPAPEFVRCAIQGQARVGLRVKNVLRLYGESDARAIDECVRVLRNR